MGINDKDFNPEKKHNKFPPFELETRNRKIIKTLYKTLASCEFEAAAKLVASDLEWWFHGPQKCNHMMHVLTGEQRRIDFEFKPRRLMAVGDRVIVEGWQGSKAYWVHVWTLKDGIITQFREYFDTWLTVIRRASDDGDAIRIWQSESRLHLNRSLPHLVLAM